MSYLWTRVNVRDDCQSEMTKEILGSVNMLLILLMVMGSPGSTYVKTHLIVHLKYGQFIVCQLYFSKAIFKKSLPIHNANFFF